MAKKKKKKKRKYKDRKQVQVHYTSRHCGVLMRAASIARWLDIPLTDVCTAVLRQGMYLPTDEIDRYVLKRIEAYKMYKPEDSQERDTDES